MARRIKIQARSCPSIKEAFDDFLLHKKASGLAEKTCRTYREQFAAICKHLDSSVPITSLVKRQLEEMLEKKRDSGLKDTSINSCTRTLPLSLSIPLKLHHRLPPEVMFISQKQTPAICESLLMV